MRLDNGYPVSILMVWFGVFAAIFVVIPSTVVWLYILALPVLIVYGLYQKYRAGNLHFRPSIIDLSIFAYTGYILLSIFTNDTLPLNIDLYVGEILFRVVTPFTIYWFIRLNPLPDNQMRYWVYFLAVLVIIETIFGFITLFVPLILPEAYQPRPVHLYKRATGTFVTPSNYVLQLFVGIVFLFYRIRQLAPSRERMVLLVIAIIGMIGVLISQNRGGWLVLSILLVILIYLEPSLGRWVFGAFAIFVVVTLLVRPSFFTQSFNRLTEWRQVESRITMGVAGAELFLDKPIFGWGYGTYDLYDWQYMRTVGTIEPTRYEVSVATSHNTYLTILSESGLVGFILYMFPTVVLFYRTVISYIKRQHHRDTDIILTMWLLIGVIHTAAQFADFRFFPFILGYWWMALGIVANELDMATDTPNTPAQATP